MIKRFESQRNTVLSGCFILIFMGTLAGWRLTDQIRLENKELHWRLEASRNLQETGRHMNFASRERKSQKLLKEMDDLRKELLTSRNVAAEFEELKHENQSLKQISAQRSSVASPWFTWVASVRSKGVEAAEVDDLLLAMAQGNTDVRVEAAKALRTIGLEQMLDNHLTAEARADWQAAGRKAIPLLLEALKDPEVFLRANAAITLGFLRQEPERVVPALVLLLDDPEERAALAAAKGLSRLQQLSKPAESALLRMSQSPEPARKAAALEALRQIAPDTLKGRE